MKLVTAIADGYFGGYVKAGTQFHVPDDAVASWFHAEGEEPQKIDRVLHHSDVKGADTSALQAENEALKKQLKALEKNQSEELEAMKVQMAEMQKLVEDATAPAKNPDKAPKK